MTSPHERHGLIDRQGTCLVLIDIQEKLFPLMRERDRLLENTLRLARFSEIMKIPVVLTEQKKLGGTLQQIRELLPEEHPVEKTAFNAFRCETFRDRIGSLSPRTIVLAGIEAHICVTQTALHALPAHRVHVISDAVAARLPGNRRVGLDRMAGAGVTVSSTEMFLFELLVEAGTDTFRKVLPLVK
ncbi:MAG: isochorismatase family protein [Deltaproteobacteria bacterium]|nr:isochorismatase family protein [Deltaproteobacteria bacterium]